MCLILFAACAHPDYPLIVAANRDERYTRPSTPAGFWPDYPTVCAGRDLEQGGTWLGIATDGRFAGITNYRQGRGRGTPPHSRGDLTRGFLTGTRGALEYMQDAAARPTDYHGYSLIAGTPDALYFCSNRGNGIQRITPGVHGLSNRLLDEPWPKVVRGVSVLKELLGADEPTLTRTLFELLADRTTAPDHLLPSTGVPLQHERDRSPAFISAESYGTRASTVVLMGRDGNVVFKERSFGPWGKALGETEQRFRLASPLTAGRTAVAETKVP
jgi:uncharacterized protein with NRDE domain